MFMPSPVERDEVKGVSVEELKKHKKIACELLGKEGQHETAKVVEQLFNIEITVAESWDFPTHV